MPNITIDTDKLKTLLDISHAFTNAISELVTAPEPPPKAVKRGRPPKNSGMCPNCSEAYMYCACADNPLNKKPSKLDRPKKSTPIVAKDVVNDPELSPEEITSIIQEKLPPQNANTVAAKRPNWVAPQQGDSEHKICITESVTDNKKKIQFIDLQNVGDRIPLSKYPPRSDRRDPAKLMKFTCYKCGRSFEDYPSSRPEAFVKFSAQGMPGIENKPLIKCDNCTGMS